MDCFVKEQKEKYANIWLNLDCNMDSLPIYDKSYKKKREIHLGKSISDVLEYISQIQIDKNNKQEYRQELKEFIRSEMKSSLGLSNASLEYLLFKDLLDIADKFIIDAEELCDDLSFLDIMQAMRNVWIMNTLQLIAGIDIEYTPSIFAYSMIYPYTDNFLDDDCTAHNEKERFNDSLGKRLYGQNIKVESNLERRVYSLIEMIEKQYDRKKHPKVYESIIAIYKAQLKSLYQQKNYLNINEILNISIEKGGTSVLADGYLVCADMSNQMASFSMGFGFVLQLIDDLQDISCDRQSKSMTMFSRVNSKRELENTTRKLLSLVYRAFDMEFCTSPYAEDIKKLMCDNCIMMIMDAIVVERKLFSKKFLKEIEKFSQVRLKFFQRARKKIKARSKDIDLNDFR